jgi:hypothetical protein
MEQIPKIPLTKLEAIPIIPGASDRGAEHGREM